MVPFRGNPILLILLIIIIFLAFEPSLFAQSDSVPCGQADELCRTFVNALYEESMENAIFRSKFQEFEEKLDRLGLTIEQGLNLVEEAQNMKAQWQRCQEQSASIPKKEIASLEKQIEEREKGLMAVKMELVDLQERYHAMASECCECFPEKRFSEDEIEEILRETELVRDELARRNLELAGCRECYIPSVEFPTKGTGYMKSLSMVMAERDQYETELKAAVSENEKFQTQVKAAQAEKDKYEAQYILVMNENMELREDIEIEKNSREKADVRLNQLLDIIQKALKRFVAAQMKKYECSNLSLIMEPEGAMLEGNVIEEEHRENIRKAIRKSSLASFVQNINIGLKSVGNSYCLVEISPGWFIARSREKDDPNPLVYDKKELAEAELMDEIPDQGTCNRNSDELDKVLEDYTIPYGRKAFWIRSDHSISLCSRTDSGWRTVEPDIAFGEQDIGFVMVRSSH